MIRTAWDRLTTTSPAAIAAGLAGLHVVAAGLAFDPTPHSGGDNAAYLVLARSLLEHGRYLQLWDPAAGPHAQYPPGFPALLALAMALGIEPWVRLKLLMVAISAAAVALSYAWMRERTPPGIALGAGLLVALAPGVVQNSHWILSDGAFWAATMGTLWFAARDRPGPTVAFAFLALLFRTAAVPLVLAVLLWLALRRRWTWVAGAAGTLVALATVWTLRARGSAVPYASELWLANPYVPDRGTIGLAGFLDRILDNAGGYAFQIFPALLTGATGILVDVLAGFVIGFALVGWARRLRAPGLAELFLPLYLGVVLAWPGPWAADRFLLPVLPLVLVLAAEGAEPLLRRRFAGPARALAFALVLAMSAPPLLTQWRLARDCRAAAVEFPSRCFHPEVRAFLALAAWTRDRLPEDAAALSRKPTFLYYFGGVPGRAYPFTNRPGALLAAAQRAGARYVVVDRLGVVARSYLHPALAAEVHRFCIVQVINVAGHEAALLGILPPDPAAGAAVGGRRRTADGAVELNFPVCPSEYLR